MFTTLVDLSDFEILVFKEDGCLEYSRIYECFCMSRLGSKLESHVDHSDSYL